MHVFHVTPQTGQPVQFVGAFAITTTTTDLPTTSALPPGEELEQLSSGAIAGIVIAVLAVVLVLAAVVVAIVALVVGYRSSTGKLSLKNTPQSLPNEVRSTQDETRFSSDWQPMTMTTRNDLPATEGNGSTEEHTEL